MAYPTAVQKVRHRHRPAATCTSAGLSRHAGALGTHQYPAARLTWTWLARRVTDLGAPGDAVRGHADETEPVDMTNLISLLDECDRSALEFCAPGLLPCGSA